MAETIELGIVGIKNMGEYSSQTQYEKLNVVTYQGSSYCALRDTKGNSPTNGDYWQLYAEKGQQGIQGIQGPQGPAPVKGVDYYTASDKLEIENDLVDDISDIVSESIGTLTSAAPLVANSIADMLDTTRVYVNLTNGHWYYYDGDSWEDGGVYQSTGIGKNNVSMYNLDNYINNSVDGIYSNIETTYENGKYLSGSGVEQSGSSEVYTIYEASINGGERLKIKTSLRGQDYGTTYDTCIYILLDEDDNIVKIHKQLLVSNLNEIELDIEVPEAAKKIKINCNTNKLLYIISSTKYKPKEKIGYNDLDDTLKTKYNLIYDTKLSSTTIVNNAYLSISNGNLIGLASANGYKVIKFNLQPRKHYLLKNFIGFYYNAVYALSSDIDMPLTLGGNVYNLKLVGDYYKTDIGGNNQLLPDMYITTPDYVTCMYVNIAGLNENIIEVYEANSVDIKEDYNINNILYGKKYVACGDSFTHGDFTGYSGPESDVYDSTLQMYKTYPYWIGQRNNMTVINEAINGSILSLSKEYVAGTQPINYKYPFSYERYQQIPADADYITIMFGLNDMYHSNIGTINDITNETFYGAGNVVLEWLITNRPDAKIGIIVSNAYLSNSYRQALRELAVKWGIGYLDLYNDTSISKTLSGNGMCETAQTIRNSQYHVTSTNGHPNVKAHIIMSHAIEDFLRKL